MTIEFLRNNDLILFECLSGSKAQGLDTPDSDTDIKGVFLLPKEEFYGLNYIPQVSNETNDIVFYELGRFMELLSLNNPNILELLNTPPESILYKHPIMDEINSSMVLSKLCANTFGRYALSQIKKARGLNKKIVNPMNKERKGVLDFCHVQYEKGSLPLLKYLKLKEWDEKDCGLVNIPNMKNLFGLYHSKNSEFLGLVRDEFSNSLKLSSVPKDHAQETLLYFNQDGYSTYCKEYKEYWEWVEKRNELRFKNTLQHGKNYDAKNMMHVFRLLEMAIEIAKHKNIKVLRKDREFLLDIKSGKFEYNELMNMAEAKRLEIEEAYQATDLMDKPDIQAIQDLTFRLRDHFYQA